MEADTKRSISALSDQFNSSFNTLKATLIAHFVVISLRVATRLYGSTYRL